MRTCLGQLLAVLAAHLPTGASVLELGAGAGVGTAWIACGLLPRDDVTLIIIEKDPQTAALAACGPGRSSLTCGLPLMPATVAFGMADATLSGRGPASGCGPSTEGRSMAARPRRVIFWVILSIIAAICLVIGAFWLYAIVTGGKYM
jgi:hypothetical protein